jgi:hypothetical protein
MSLPRTRSRKTSESERGEKTDSDKKKLGSGGHAAAIKNDKTGSPAQSKTRRRSSITEHTKPSNKLETKKRTVSDAHTKPIHAGNEKIMLRFVFLLLNINSIWNFFFKL